MAARVDYDLLQEEKDGIVNYDESLNNKQKVWLSSTLYLLSIHIGKQEFTAKGTISLLFMDQYLIKQLTSSGHTQLTNIKCDSLSTEIKDTLPINTSNVNDLFENTKKCVHIEPAVISFTNKGTILMTIKIEATFYQQFKIKGYPRDAHPLNMKLCINKQRYLWKQEEIVPDFVNEYAQDTNKECYKYHISFSLAQFEQRREWISYSPILGTRKGFDIYLISFRVKRKLNMIISTIVLPLFFVIGSTFCIYAIDYQLWETRIFIIFLSFVCVAIITQISQYQLSSLSVISVSYIVLSFLLIESVLIGTNTFEINDIDTLNDMDWISAMFAGLIWVVGLSQDFKGSNPRKKWRAIYDQQWYDWGNSKNKFIRLRSKLSYWESIAYE